MLHPNILVPVVAWEETQDGLSVSGIRILKNVLTRLSNFLVENFSLF